MAISVEEFWRLAIEGGLFVPAERQEMSDAFDRLRGDRAANAVSLCKWLIEHGMLSRYQAKLLMNGRSGPFHFGDYRVYDRVESGRLTGLFRAGHLHNGQPALLSFFTGPHTQNPARWQAVEAAARAAIKIQHPHVCRAEELVQTGGYKFMVLEMLDGRSLAEQSGGKPLPPGEVCRYIRKAAAGLSRLHNLGHMHGDVRPDNILLDGTGQLKLLYFPLSRDPFADAAAGEQNADFLPPERAAPHHGPPDVRGDIYALGATMYALLAGRPPFPGGDAVDKARRHAGEPLPPLAEVVNTPSSLSRLVAMMMSKNPQGRPANVTEVADALQTIVERKSAAARASASAANGKSSAGGPAAEIQGSPATPSAAPPAPAAYPAQMAPPAMMPPAMGPPTMGPPALGPPVMGASGVLPAPGWMLPPGRMAPGPSTSGGPPPPNGAFPPSATMPPAYAGYPSGAPAPPTMQPAMQPGMQRPAQAPPGYAAAPPAYAAPPGYAAQPAPAAPTAIPTPPAAAAPSPPVSAPPAATASQQTNEAVPAPQPAAARRAPAAKRAVRKTPAPPKSQLSQLDPKWVSAGVAAGVFVLGAIIAFISLRGPKPVAIKDSAEMAELHRQMEEANKDLNRAPKPAKARSPKPRESGEMAMASSSSGDASAKAPDSNSPDSDSGGLELIEDDGRTLWASPTSGSRLDLHYVPPGTRVIMALRPADLLQSIEGEKILAALGPGAAAARADLEAMVGIPLGDIEQLLGCFYSLDEGPPQFSLVARLAKKRGTEELLAAWKKPTPSESQPGYYRGAQWAYYLPAAGDNKVFTVAPLKEMEEAGDLGDEPPELGKELDKLARQTDATRTFTLLFAPNYLNGAGRELMEGELAPLREPLADFLGGSVRAVSLSVNWGNDFFAELRAYGGDESPAELAGRYNDGIAQLPDRVESYVASLNPGPYSRLLLLRFPQMLRVASEYTRTGDDENQAVVRCFLPLAAGHNLLMAGELLASQGNGGGGGGAVAKKPRTPADALGQKITLSFTRDTLEKCMEYLSREIDTEIVIIGTDLQLEGITKNQSFGLDEKDKPAREILQTVMLKANSDGKLVYVFKPKAPGGKDIIFITTRAAVAKNKYTLPPELAKAPEPVKK